MTAILRTKYQYLCLLLAFFNWVGTRFQQNDKQDGGQKEIIHFHIVRESFPKKTLQISVEKEGLAFFLT